MASEELRVSALIAASPNRIYSAWMDERQHSAFTGGRATIDPWVGGRHTAWDNYIEGTLVELDTGRRIVMTWRTSEFPPTVGDSKVEVQLEPVAGGTRVSVHHTQIPQGQSDRYKKVWRTHYLGPMKKYFGKPGAMRAALQAASKAGMLPIPGVTSARPGASRAAQPPRPEAEAGPETVAGASEGEGRRTAARPAPKKAPAKKKAAGKRKAPAKKKASTKKKAAAKKKKAAGKRKAPAKKKASTKKKMPAKKKKASTKKKTVRRSTAKKKTSANKRAKKASTKKKTTHRSPPKAKKGASKRKAASRKTGGQPRAKRKVARKKTPKKAAAKRATRRTARSVGSRGASKKRR